MTDAGVIHGKAAAIPIDNLDTDQIMPKQFLRGIDKSGLAHGVLHDLRFDTDGCLRPDFVLNQPAFADTTILLGGANFGCGSSREHAVWGLLQFGVQAVIAPSFAEIFYSNAMGNRLLLVRLPDAQVQRLMELSRSPAAPQIAIDVNSRRVHCGDEAPAPFEISERHRAMILSGLDVIGQSLAWLEDIERFARDHWARQPWMPRLAARAAQAQPTPSSSTSNFNVAFGGITPPAPRAP